MHTYKLSDLLRSGLISESYVPVKEFREKRSLVRHRIVLSRTKTKLANKIHAILDKYESIEQNGQTYLENLELTG